MPSLTWCTLLACLTTLKYALGQNNTKFINLHMGIFPELLFVVPASFKLAKIVSLLMLHLLPC